ncbi:DivIVA domain-containing protein [Cryptosporangium sp. NPDC051539]|uniref:DivIVA domain-containing protein n=1 Tax=Cryptosporangium sp. NPDC051539 TaxID=3363962 RepID=UPI0037A48832
MGSFLLIVVAAIILAGIVFGAAAFTLGRDRGLTPPRPDGVPFDLPADRPLDRADVDVLRFDTGLRGYRMDQVDDLLARVADDFDFLHTRIIDLEDQLAARRGDSEDDERPFDFPWANEDGSGKATAPPAETGVAGTTEADDAEVLESGDSVRATSEQAR